jgi:hypothetical protein
MDDDDDLVNKYARDHQQPAVNSFLQIDLILHSQHLQLC